MPVSATAGVALSAIAIPGTDVMTSRWDYPAASAVSPQATRKLFRCKRSYHVTWRGSCGDPCRGQQNDLTDALYWMQLPLA